MKQPSQSVRIMGSPFVASALAVCGILMIDAWAQGPASFWFALVGCSFIAKAFSCTRRMKVYKAWLKEWDSVGSFGMKEPKLKMRPSRVLTFTAAGLFIGILGYWPQAEGRPPLQHLLVWVWLGCGLFLIVRLIVGVGRLIIKRRDRIGRSDAAPVSWMLSGAMDAPSRMEATQRLPEYAARVLTPQRVTAGVVTERHI